MQPPSTEQVEQLRDAIAEPALRAVVTFTAGTGLRQGEVFGLTVDRLHMLRREVTVDRQLVKLPRQPARLGPPTTKVSVRTVPLPQVVVDALAVHLAAFPPGPDGLVFTLEGEPVTRQAFGRMWAPAAKAAGLPAGTGLHLLRHYYALLLIRYGESVKTVRARLGHATAAETLGHLLAPLAGLRRPHARGRRLPTLRGFSRTCGLRADWRWRLTALSQVRDL